MTSPPASAPWHFFATHRHNPHPYFLDRAGRDRPSFAGSRPVEQLVVDATGRAHRWSDGRWHDEAVDPVQAVSSFVERSSAAALDVPEWLGDAVLPRTVGYLGYELGRYTEGMPHDVRDAVAAPLAVLSTYDEFDARHPVTGCEVRVRFATAGSAAAPPPSAPPPSAPPLPASRWEDSSAADYRRAFGTLRESIAAGDIYQANLSRRVVFELPGEACEAYARLREVQPVPYGAFLDFGGFALLSNSPECFLERHGDFVATRPIKGTRPRRESPELDAIERATLAADAKERAEHLMIVDLERNDLGRVARTGSVEVRDFAKLHSFATVHHLHSEVRALLRPHTDLATLLRATFPGGSITGAPKIRAMALLANVEGSTRGPYTGAIGCFNGSEGIDLSIAIRTAVASAGRALYSAGGGIVADSDPAKEWEETEWKLGAMRRSLAAA
jgi:para-aminobenzoate synthetase component 1